MNTCSFRSWLAVVAFCLSLVPASARKVVVDLKSWGIVPNCANDSTLASRLQGVLAEVQRNVGPTDRVVLRFEKGEYHFHAADAPSHVIYISNHDQEASKRVGVWLEEWHNLTLDGNGADFLFHGRLIPLVLSRCENTVLRDFHIDFPNPQIAQVQVVKNSPEEGITFEVAPWVEYRINAEGRFETYGEGWTGCPSAGIAFERDTRHIVYNTADLGIHTAGVRDLGGRQLLAPGWKDERLVPGTVVAMRTYSRPCPGIVMRNDVQTRLQNVQVHYAEGMGLIAQRCTDITLDRFGVCLRGDGDPRYFTTQADATHFSQCKGKIVSKRGLYEGMMDDAINIHGIYLRVRERIDDHTLRCRYEHGQAWGFDWGDVGDKVQFLASEHMAHLPFQTTIASIRPADTPAYDGCRELIISFRDALPAEITAQTGWGIENLTWTPEVEFRHNIVRNNRARGALFSSPRRTVCADNLFDHTSGAAIVLCGDCNGWYESGAVRDLVIRRNTFINALTSLYQFTNAVISIYPEIPRLEETDPYFHGGSPRAIVIEDNDFATFDAPLLYAKSVDGLVFRKNRLKKNRDYKPYHWIQQPILVEHCRNAETEAPRLLP